MIDYDHDDHDEDYKWETWQADSLFLRSLVRGTSLSPPSAARQTLTALLSCVPNEVNCLCLCRCCFGRLVGVDERDEDDDSVWTNQKGIIYY